MEALFTGKNRIYREELDSTQAFATEMLQGSHPVEGTTIVAGNQLKGVGQGQNSWQSHPGKNILISVIYYPTFLSPQTLFQLNKAAALGVHDTLLFLCPDLEVKIKWPNDILVNRKKVAGILLHNQLSPSKVSWSIWGIGINVNQAHFPLFPIPADSIQNLTGKSQDKEKTIDILLHFLEKRYMQLKTNKNTLIDESYLSALFGYGKQQTFAIGEKKFEALISDIDANGKLGLEIENAITYFDMKEIRFLL